MENLLDQKDPNRIHNIYNDHRKNIHLNDGIKSDAIISDDLYQVLYPKLKNTLQSKLIAEVIQSYANIVPENLQDYENTIKNTLNNLDKQSAVFVFPHATFAGLPLFITELLRLSQKHQTIPIEDQIYTIFGPSLMTQKIPKKGILNISHGLKTIPINGKSNITAFDEALQQGQLSQHPLSNVKKNFLKILLSKSQDPGNIFLLAPTGTRDLVQRTPYGDIQSIAFQNDSHENVQTSLKLIQKLSKQGNKIILVGMNEAALKMPGKTQAKDNSWTPGSVYLSLKELSPEMVNDLIQQGTFMETLADLIKDKNGNIVGKALSKEEYLASKNAKKILPNPNYNLTDCDFVSSDTIKKKLIRILFELLIKN